MDDLKTKNLVNRVNKLETDVTNMGSDVSKLKQRMENSKAVKSLTDVEEPSPKTATCQNCKLSMPGQKSCYNKEHFETSFGFMGDFKSRVNSGEDCSIEELSKKQIWGLHKNYRDNEHLH